MPRSPLRTASHAARFTRHVAALALIGATFVPGAAFAASGDGVTFNWGLSAEEIESWTLNYLSRGETDPALSTGGLRTITSGTVSASVNAWVDAESGTVKALTTATTGDAGRPTSTPESYARLDLTDTVRISGPGATTTVTFRMSYDSQFSGLELSPFERVNQ